MKSLAPAIYLGDFAEALARLSPQNAEAQQAIARLLGFAWVADPAAAKPPEPPPVIPAPGGSHPPPAPRPPRVPRKPRKSPEPPREDEPRWLPSTLETETANTSTLPIDELFAGIARLPDDPAGEAATPAPEPLFRREWARSILMALLATSREGEIDFARLVEQFGSGRPPQRLPRLPWPTLRRGVQILLDVGPAMTPFAHDQAGLVAQIRLVAGAEGTRVARFTGSPLRGAGAGLAEDWRPWQPPSAGTPVLLVSDLGASPAGAPGERAPEAEWLELAALARRADCPLVALVPLRPARLSAALRRAMIVVPWDRRTNAGRLRRLIGHALHVD